ncbi:hypothetical protein [Salisediminibacterium halotolerans]|uniref:hypothetical protein n=1 Tax=Salisediminibacterium halotolerans TaxID=517425 RepID=UPI000EAE281D|nr:hypothetical protein [Salisediminibacterium halotolerans]RLJ71690.1 allantoate deiminase [Actinophytocola xinjiangensis]RPE86840.1 hypothetical protein EDD67_1702 [Salisediminibacterium halotolerans]TWG32903.1 allantoate deiminase [Salisediminibacterium halotolerans]GEL07757.1 hypothetical protein SHA02_11730 [Salisediminibacterium halotolerans]
MKTDMNFSTPALADYIAKLSAIGRTHNHGTTRLLYSESWMQAQEQLAAWFAESGLTVSYDDIGNLYGQIAGTREADLQGFRGCV